MASPAPSVGKKFVKMAGESSSQSSSNGAPAASRDKKPSEASSAPQRKKGKSGSSGSRNWGRDGSGGASVTPEHYVARRLKDLDERNYKAGGVLVLRPGDKSGQYFALVGIEHRCREAGGVKVTVLCSVQLLSQVLLRHPQVLFLSCPD